MCLELRTYVKSLRFLLQTGAAEERGAEMVEAALVLPLLLTLLLGIVWIGNAYSAYETMTRAAREGARYALAPTCATCGNALPSSSQVQTVVNNALSAGSLKPSNVQNYNFQQNVLLNGSNPPPACPNPLGANQECGVVVSFTYPVQLAIPFTSLNATTLSLNTQVQMRQENQ